MYKISGFCLLGYGGSLKEIGLLLYRVGLRIDRLDIDVHSFRLMFTAYEFMSLSQNDLVDEQFPYRYV